MILKVGTRQYGKTMRYTINCKEYPDIEGIGSSKDEAVADFHNKVEVFEKAIDKDHKIAVLKEQVENAIVCPCIVGDTVYAVRTRSYGFGEKKHYIEKAAVKEIGWDKKGVYIVVGGTRSNLSGFNKNIFLTEVEANRRLKELG